MAKVDELLGSPEPTIAGLNDELMYLAERRGEVPEGGFEITVMGDKELPYWLLKRRFCSRVRAPISHR